MNQERITCTLLEILEDRTATVSGRVEAARLLLPLVGLDSKPELELLHDEKTSELMACARLVLDEYRNAIRFLEYDGALYEYEAAASRELADNLDAAITALEGEE